MNDNLLLTGIFIELAFLVILIIVYFFSTKKVKRILIAKKEVLNEVRKRNQKFMIEKKELIERLRDEITYLLDEMKIIDLEIKKINKD